MKGLGISARLGFGIPTPGAAQFSALQAAESVGSEAARLAGVSKHLSKEAIEELGEGIITRAIAGEVEAHPPDLALLRSVMDDTLGAIEHSVPTGLKRFVQGTRRLYNAQQGALWEKFHTPLKFVAHSYLTDTLIAAKNGQYKAPRFIKMLQGKLLKNMSDDEISRSVGRYVNDQFGGQNFALHFSGLAGQLNRHPEALKALRSIMISPDWFISTMRSTMAAVTEPAKGLRAAIPGVPERVAGPGMDMARFILGLRHWKNAALGPFLYANLLNRVFTGIGEGEGHWIWENESGKDLFHLELPAVDSTTGRKLFMRWGKVYAEPEAIGIVFSSEAPFVRFEPAEILNKTGAKMLPAISSFRALLSG
ncbi:MAG: hypothetical protein L0170_07025, partial [Acidobacteria bacterium]|nr:hypothetical protein [Acidobacteriota bacterium]